MTWSQTFAVMICATLVILLVNWVAVALQFPDVARVLAVFIVGSVALAVVFMWKAGPSGRR
jgi:hypothetical protein